MNTEDRSKLCQESYSRLKNLKLVEQETGIKWQTVYVHLKKAGVAVVGDKARYGSATDRFAAKAERIFAELVSDAVDNNESEFQSTIDFDVNGLSVDIKAATLNDGSKNLSKKIVPRWAFCVNKQRDIADFFVLYAFDASGDKVLHTFLIPGEVVRTKTTISITASKKSKWFDYLIDQADIPDFFDQMNGD